MVRGSDRPEVMSPGHRARSPVRVGRRANGVQVPSFSTHRSGARCRDSATACALTTRVRGSVGGKRHQKGPVAWREGRAVSRVSAITFDDHGDPASLASHRRADPGGSRRLGAGGSAELPEHLGPRRGG
jgi:hypothetical protein